VVVYAWAGWWSSTSGVLSKVGCSGSSVMVGRIWVDGWRGGLSLDSCDGPSPWCRRWLSLLGGIIRVVFDPRTRWAPCVGLNSRSLSIPEHKGVRQGETRGLFIGAVTQDHYNARNAPIYLP
jgi:hypothetical protein